MSVRKIKPAASLAVYVSILYTVMAVLKSPRYEEVWLMLLTGTAAAVISHLLYRGSLLPYITYAVANSVMGTFVWFNDDIFRGPDGFHVGYYGSVLCLAATVGSIVGLGLAIAAERGRDEGLGSETKKNEKHMTHTVTVFLIYVVLCTAALYVRQK